MDTYQQALTIEDNIRNHFNDPNYNDDPMHTDPYYNLIEITPIVLETFTTGEKPVNVLFKPVKAIPQSWRQTKYSLSKLDYLMNISNLFIAGGRVYSSLFGTETNDIDIFIWGLTQEQAYNKATHIISILLDKHGANNCTLMRTANAISINADYIYHNTICYGNHIRHNYQIILRLYHSPSEILHGFDIDSCCVGYDGEKIWATQRAIFSLTNGYNTVNFDRMSPSYEYRLVKYATRGMSIFIPNFKAENMLTNSQTIDSLVNIYNRVKKDPSIENLTGLDILLCTNVYWEYNNYEPSLAKYMFRYIPKISDYEYNGYTEISLYNLHIYMSSTAKDYPKLSAKYLPYLNKLTEYQLKMYMIPNPFKNKNIQYIKISPSFNVSADDIIAINSKIYDAMDVIAQWDIPRIINFRESNPGEQMTNTFHKTVLEDRSIWYNGLFYNE